MENICGVCGALLPPGRKCQDLQDELSFYTLNHSDPVFFIHQYVVDVYAAQHADENTKPMKIAFALVGLYLAVEKDYTGRQVQLVHMELARTKREYQKFDLPLRFDSGQAKDKGGITVADVLAVKPGQKRNDMIKQWITSVWQAYGDNRAQIVNLLRNYDT